jgi:hypothetical protein
VRIILESTDTPQMTQFQVTRFFFKNKSNYIYLYIEFFFRDCRWFQAILREIGQSCVRRLIAELQAGVTPLPLYSFNHPSTYI